jgi:hypothetical protein
MLALFCFILSCPGQAAAGTAGGDLIVVNKKTNKLGYFSGGRLEKEFPVATGKKPGLTPEGTFSIANKIKNRPYYKEKIPGGDPRNPLGDRWLGLDVNGTRGSTYAIHGNNNKKSIGKYVSAGCIRMYNDDIHWLFSHVKVGTKVVITSSGSSLAKIASGQGYALGVQKLDGKLVVDGEGIRIEGDLLMADSRIYIPMRECLELLGADVRWNRKGGTVEAAIGKLEVSHKPLTGKAVVNGKTVKIAPSRLMGNMIMLPLRNVEPLTGFAARWDDKTNTVYIDRK